MSDKLGPLGQSAITHVERSEAAARRERHAGVELSEDKTVRAEAGGAGEKLTWSAYVKKVWKGPWTTGATFKW
jgi:hypothetical protein